MGGRRVFVGEVAHKCAVVHAIHGAQGACIHPVLGYDAVHRRRRAAVDGSNGRSAVCSVEREFGLVEHFPFAPQSFETFLSVEG